MIEDSGPAGKYTHAEGGGAMLRFVLCGNFVGNDPAQRFCARNRELHVPEIHFG
jgi:hypothetical protein